MNTYICTLDSGHARLEWPKDISEEDYAFVEMWLETMKKKIQRSVKTINEDVTALHINDAQEVFAHENSDGVS